MPEILLTFLAIPEAPFLSASPTANPPYLFAFPTRFMRKATGSVSLPRESRMPASAVRWR